MDSYPNDYSHQVIESKSILDMHSLMAKLDNDINTLSKMADECFWEAQHLVSSHHDDLDDHRLSELQARYELLSDLIKSQTGLIRKRLNSL